MGYFNHVLFTFLGLASCSDIAAYGWFRKLSNFIKNILICVPKMNKGLKDLEQHEGD